MYTRRYTAPYRTIVPPPDYSGTAIARGEKENRLIPPPSLPQDEKGVAWASEASSRIPAPEPQIEDDEERKEQAEIREQTASEERKDGRRPDLGEAPSEKPRRFTVRAPFRGNRLRQGNSTKRPIAVREDEEGFRPLKRERAQAWNPISGESDDLLLLGLLFFLLSGEDVKEHFDLLLILGVLLFASAS